MGTSGPDRWRHQIPRRGVRQAAVALLLTVGIGCSTSAKVDTAARDRCEQGAGVGNCLLRSGKWVPIGSHQGTTPTTSAPETTVTTVATSLPSSVTTTPLTSGPPPGPRNVLTEPAGLFCRDLRSRGYSYTAAVDYWRAHGEPNQMDADRNGIPCETVFARGDVASYWGLQPAAPRTGGPPGGLSCKQLYAAGYSYPTAVAYWYYEGVPARMDIDGNGIPCETVYPPSTVNAFWFG